MSNLFLKLKTRHYVSHTSSAVDFVRGLIGQGIFLREIWIIKKEKKVINVSRCRFSFSNRYLFRFFKPLLLFFSWQCWTLDGWRVSPPEGSAFLPSHILPSILLVYSTKTCSLSTLSVKASKCIACVIGRERVCVVLCVCVCAHKRFVVIVWARETGNRKEISISCTLVFEAALRWKSLSSRVRI